VSNGGRQWWLVGEKEDREESEKVAELIGENYPHLI